MQVDIPSPSDVKHVLNSGAEFHWVTPSNFFFLWSTVIYITLIFWRVVVGTKLTLLH